MMHTFPVKNGQKNGSLLKTRTDQNGHSGLRFMNTKMYWYEKLCVPETVTGRVIRTHHAEIGHVGGKELWKEIQRWYHFTPGAQAEKLAEIYLDSSKPVKHTIRRI